MRELLSPLGLAALLAFAPPALAQDSGEDGATTPTEAETTGETAGTEDAAAAPTQTEAEQPQAYVRDTFTDWRVICAPVADGREACTMQQLLLDANENAVSKVSIAALPDAAAPRVAGIEIATPLETLLSRGLRIQIDASEPWTVPFTYCRPDSCIAQFSVEGQQLDALKAGAEAAVAIIPLRAPDQPQEVTMSLSGFTAAFESLQEMLPQ
ncbi:Invasion protein IalB, involved in pathogenesis [Rhodovulum sp. ES.010]|uniref:invasion associated locus B family protein n=1 Tax=Rhodovulum sp. ES.010 TaxID=1882821 RepID=UPI0009291D88|nr:invasion associated locus B family protein [Rhodovulum sp. ES.010]SIO17137.1 Invasion protein IalB, involved in pathogenesis [Rhodovulum sp. ES.010]